MTVDTLVETVLALSSSQNLLLVGGGALCCLLTGLIKRLIPKLKIDLTNSFDPTVYMPFLLGGIISATSTFFMDFSSFGDRLAFIIVEALAMGAVAMVFYRFVSSLNGTSLKQLLKDDMFSLVYNQLICLTDAKDRLLDGSLKLKDFVDMIQTLAANSGVIYSSNCGEEQKKERLKTLMGGIFDNDAINGVIDALHISLAKKYC
jgi:hypothetical protein